MKVEFYITDCFHSESSQSLCFYAEPFIRKALSSCSEGVYGIAIIDGVTAKFYFSPLGMDGAIFTSNPDHRSFLKLIIPSWYYFNHYLKGVD